MEPRNALQKGFLVLADVSGYTAFLTQSELDHAQDILHSLFEVLIAEMRDPLVVCELEGDAVFAYAPEGSLDGGAAMMELADRLYAAFAGTREEMQYNTTCTCTACRLIPLLDLKVVAHHGAFVLHQLNRGHRPKPSGPDVILAHRLLKNEIREELGVDAYAFITEACGGCLPETDEGAPPRRHTEHYDHLGTVSGHVYDLRARWEAARAAWRAVVSPEEAWIAVETDIAAPPRLVWDYLHDPVQKQRWREADEIRAFDLRKGRTGMGTTHHCVHGDMVIVERIIDWQPFDYSTVDSLWPLKATARMTVRLAPLPTGTRVTSYLSRPAGTNRAHTAFVHLFYAFMRKQLQRDYQSNMERLRTLLAEAPGEGHPVAAEATA